MNLPAIPLPKVSLRPSPALLNPLLACTLLFTASSTICLGVFTVPVERTATPPGSLTGVWPSAMGAMHFASAPLMILTGIILDAGQIATPAPLPLTASKTFRARLLAALTALSYACLFLAGSAVARSNVLLIRLAVLAQAFPLGISYLLAIELLVAWNPRRPGVAVGCGQMAFGLGNITLAAVFQYLQTSFGIVSAINLSAVLLTMLAIPSALLLRWPVQGEVAELPLADPSTPLLAPAERGVKIPWPRLCGFRSFWLYITVVFTCSAGYAFIPYFFKLGSLFDQDIGELVSLYQLTSLLSTVFAVLGSMLTDAIRYGDGFFFSGSRNLFTVVLATQTVLLLSLRSFTDTGNFTGYTVVVTVILVMLGSQAGCAALLARDLFSPANSCIVFGIGAGLAMGSGEGYSTGLMALVEARKPFGVAPSASTYDLFFVIAAAWSFVGLLCVLVLDKCDEAFDDGVAAEMKAIVEEEV